MNDLPQRASESRGVDRAAPEPPGEWSEAERRAALVLESIADPVVAFDRQGLYTYVSRLAAQVLGKAPAEMIGRRIWDFFPAGDARTLEQACERAWAEGKPVVCERYSELLGRWVENCIYPLENGAAMQWRDVTERKRAEQALRESEERFRQLVEVSAQIVWVTDARGGAIGDSPSWQAFTGRTADQMRGWRWLEAVHPDDRERIEKEWREAVERGRPARIEFRQLNASGEYRDMSCHAVPVLNLDGTVREWIGMDTDVTERLAAERKLRESEERLRLALDAGQTGTFELWPETGEGFWDARCKSLWGVPPDWDLAFGDALKRVHPEDRPGFERSLAAALKGDSEGLFVSEFRIVRPDSSIRWTHLRARVWFAGTGEQRRAVRMIGLQRDISERKRVERELARAMRRLNAHIDNSPLAVVEFDRQFHVTRWSEEAERVFGWSAHEILGRAMTEMPWIHEDDMESVARVAGDMLSGKRPRNVAANRNYRKDGSVIDCEWYNSAIYDEEGRLTSILSQVLDVTQRNRAAERLRQAQKMESVALLAGGVAHDFNNLLVAVIGNASLACEELPAETPARRLLEEIIRSGERAAHLTQQLLAYSGQGRFIIEPVNLSGAVREVIELVGASIPKNIAVRLELEPDLPPIEADNSQIHQALANLVLNASEAIGGRPGTIVVRTGVRLERPRGEPDTGDLAPGMYVFLEVSDTGCGMDETTKARIFDPFFTTKFLGRGLGLAAVAGIVRGHKGVIRVRTEPGSGTAFLLLFPAISAERAGSCPAGAPPAGWLQAGGAGAA